MDGNAFRMRFLAVATAAAVAAFALRHGTVATRLTSRIEREATAALEFLAAFDDLPTATHLAAAERNSVAAVFQVGHAFASAAQLTALVVYGFPAALPVRNSVLDDAIAAGLPIRIHLLAVAAMVDGTHDIPSTAAHLMVRLVGNFVATFRVRIRTTLDSAITTYLCPHIFDRLTTAAFHIARNHSTPAATFRPRIIRLLSATFRIVTPIIDNTVATYFTIWLHCLTITTISRIDNRCFSTTLLRF